ncbi:putative bifunctional diguanylate cyclase/phosphodiesterase [Propionivibrio dicarboxylicus]|uniref:PAS domain S-box-containing protein/diguanylate cyclase (GGDEF) domain-containing protein n=1 Tax=Propionivibrio dicarboxylicus TaxID=83767 RepID=A0A1G7Z908_9RHOO|nr:EAL domain-containing protein [Propionivibrio dicarboxylicus]SDH05184.1 PAS domain S-box-containing protein/diguanylate cyclase (GGDEF) domain-containing protein [Propionivibrio dicarboxylicus]
MDRTARCSPSKLRRRAEENLAKQSTEFPVNETDAQRLLHELQVHQVELEMQNSELRRLQSALEESEERLRVAMETTRDALVILEGEHGAITVWNPAAEAIFGFKQADVLGLSLHEFLTPPRFREAARRGWEHFFRSGEGSAVGKTQELVALRKDGTEIPIELSLSAMKLRGKWQATGIARDITERKRYIEKLEYQSNYDELTGLPNRTLFQDRASQAMEGCYRTGHHGALLFLDLDNFKVLNDTRGHAIGDQMLVETAKRIVANVRADDTVARLGGDEFVVMLKELSRDAAEAAVQTRLVGEKIRESLAQSFTLIGGEFHCSASFGASLFRGHNITVETLLKQADMAMYKAKSCGRNALYFFDPRMQSALDERTLLEADLRMAVARGQLRLYYQAQFGQDRRILGAEALLRWEHPTRGQVSPGDFIPLAEASGLILSVGHWVLETACTQIRAWAAMPETRELRLAVNVSARQFQQPEFVAEVLQVLKDSGADPSRLKLELTESMRLEDIEDSIDKMHALKAHGIAFSIDDFGTGHSSLAYLTRLPLYQIKIDRSFIRNLPDSQNDAVVAQTIISMAQSLGLEVIAEGVETESQRIFLERHNCRVYQGYLFSKPVPLGQFEELLNVTDK